MNNKIYIQRYVNGITLNPRETVMAPPDYSEPMWFNNKEEAIHFLEKKGYDGITISNAEKQFGIYLEEEYVN